MSRLIWAVTGVLLIVSAVGVLLLSIRLITQESPEQAYERGKIDGQILVFNLLDLHPKLVIVDSTNWDDSKVYRWPLFDFTDTMPVPDSLVYCGISLLIHSWDESLSYCVLCGSEYVPLNSTDTMPAVEAGGKR